MVLQSSADNASRSVKAEERLFPLWKLIGLGVSALVVLGMLYGNQRILQQVANVGNPDDVSMFFLRNIQQEHPQDESWRILLARQQLELGELSTAQKTVQPLLKGDDLVLQKDASLIDLQIMEMQMVVGVSNEQEKRELQAMMTTRIQELLFHSTTKKDLSGLADSALLAEDWPLATQVYRQLAQADPLNQAVWFRKGAQLALGKGAYVQASELFFLARQNSQKFQDKRKDYLSALKALIAGNQLQEALVQAEKHLGNLERDDAILKFLVKLGRAAGNGTFAQKYVEKLMRVSRGMLGRRFATFLSNYSATSWTRTIAYNHQYLRKELSSEQQDHSISKLWRQRASDRKKNKITDSQEMLRSYDSEVYELAYTVYAENGQVEQAYEVARTASAAVPEDMSWRMRWAQGAEWTGRPVEALQQWHVLARQTPSPEAWAAIMRLAPGLTEPANRGVVQSALTLVLTQGPQAEQRVARWALLEVLHQEALTSVDPSALTALRAHVQTLLEDVQTLAEGEQLLQVGLVHGQWAEAEQVLAHLAALGTAAQGQKWYQQSAEQALGQGAYQQAATWWFVVQGQAATRAEQRAAFQAGLQALVAGQQLAQVAPAVGLHMGALATDPEAVLSAVDALRASGAGQQASQYLADLWAAASPSYDSDIYELAYTVYAENGQVERAYEVARTASAAVPEDMSWRMRWAQGAEWIGRPVEALQQWHVLARQTPSPEAWTAVSRLGRGLRDHQAWVLGLEEMDKSSGLLPNQIKDLVNAYEKVGEPEKAIRLLQAELNKAPRKEVLMHLELIYERMGNVQEASTTLNAIREQFGSTFELAKKQARLFHQRGKLREALAVLVEEQDDAPLNDRHYWETVGDVAWDLQEDVVSRQAYETLYQHHDVSAFELERFVLLVKDVDPDRAIDLSQQGWKQFSNVGLFFLALDILQGKKEWDKIGQMFEGVTQAQSRLLEPYQPYWLVRANFFARNGNVDEALGAYQEALRRAPNSPSIGIAVLWLLIDSQQRDQLKPWLVKWEQHAETDPRFWGAFASAYMLLEKPGMALPYFDRKFQEIPDDYLWVLYYADALEAAKHRNRARKLRQYAWLTLRKEAKAGSDQAWNRDVMLAYARLALTRETGDGLSAILTRLLQHKSDVIVKELVLSWYLSREEYGPARFWLWRYYGRQLSKPTFAAIALALAENDWVAVDRLLINNESPLDRLEQVAAAKHLRRERLVQTRAFEGVEKSPNPALYAQALSDSVLSHVSSPLDTHQRLPLTAQLWSGVPHVDTRLKFQGRGALRSQQVEQLWSVPFGRGIEIHPFVSRRWQQNTDRQVFRRVPSTDTRIGAHLQWDMGSALGEFSLYHRQALSSLVAFRGRTQVNWDRRSTTEFSVGKNMEADTSVGMLVGGVKDLARISHTYQVSKWDTAFLQFDYPRFYTQDRKFLGQGFVVEGAWSHHVRLAYPDFSVRLSGNLQNYSIRDTVSGKLPTLFSSRSSTIPVSSVLPESFQQIELGTGVGESTFFSYGQSLRPFAFGGVNLNPETGVGAHLSGGLNGSLFGSDRLSLFGRYLRGGFRQDSTVTEWGLHYQLWF